MDVKKNTKVVVRSFKGAIENEILDEKHDKVIGYNIRVQPRLHKYTFYAVVPAEQVEEM